jgi:hypothetical protein
VHICNLQGPIGASKCGRPQVALCAHVPNLIGGAFACRFTHDAIRVGDRVYVCNTDGGAILELQYPSMQLRRTLSLFTAKEHINTLAVVDEQSVWVVLHNLGKVRHACDSSINESIAHFHGVYASMIRGFSSHLSASLHSNNTVETCIHIYGILCAQHSVLCACGAHATKSRVCVQSLLAQVDLDSGIVVRRIRGVGTNSHGLVAWRGVFLMLSSKETALVTLDPETEHREVIWQVLTLQTCFILIVM